MLLHASNNPHTIDVYDFANEGGVVDMVMDTAGGLLHLCWPTAPSDHFLERQFRPTRPRRWKR